MINFLDAETVAKSKTATSAAALIGQYSHLDLYVDIDVGAGSESIVVTAEVSSDGGTTWLTAPFRDLATVGGDWMTSKTFTADAEQWLRIETVARMVRVKAANSGANSAVVTITGFPN